MWKNIWGFIENELGFSKEKKRKILQANNQKCNSKKILEIYLIISNLKYLSRRDFPSLIDDTEKIKEIIKTLNIKFTDLDENSPENLLDFIYEGNYYVISTRMLEVILKHKMAYKQTEFDTRNYSTRNLSNLEKLKSSISKIILMNTFNCLFYN